ncbi:MAG TPA: Ig-like domain-containing protein [Terriglobales bacterium]|nr:Ig-like domain-containing protein [Terriglobales bacterium]
MRHSKLVRAFTAFCALSCISILWGCGASSQTKLTQIAVSPANQSIAKGDTVQFGAVGTYSDGSTQTLTDTVTWGTSSSSVATVNAQGQLLGMSQGSTQVTAAYQGLTGSTTVTVGAPALVGIVVSPNPSSLPLGESEQLNAVGKYSDGSTQDLTQSVTWGTASTGIASISATGLVSGLTAGSTGITASSGNIEGTALLTVGSAVLMSIAVTPGNPSVAAGDTQQFTAIGTYSDGSTQNLTTLVTWSSPAPGVATITSAGLATGVGVGTTSIAATLGSMNGSATLTVSSAALVSIAVTPGNPSIVAGLTQQLTATGTYSNGTTQNLTGAVTWTSTTPGVATIASSGLAKGVIAGTSIITATSGNISGATSVTVTTPVLVSIAVTPGNPSISAGTTQQFTATGTYNNSATQDVTTSATWASSVPTVAWFADASGSSAPATGAFAMGTVTAAALGTTTITASLSGVTGSTALTVTAGFVPTGSLNTGREFHTATLLNNGMILIAGGFNAGGALATAELYDPTAGTFTPTGNLNFARGQHTATLLQNGSVLVVGGSNGNGNVAASEIYNPATGTFTLTGSLNTARTMHTATMLPSGLVLIAGGIDSTGANSATAELFNSYTGAFTVTGSLNTARSQHTATLLNTGLVLIAGGNPTAAQTSAELFDPSTGAFTATGNLNSGRYAHTATLLNDSSVLIAGGSNSVGAIANAELFSPASGTFAPTGSLSTARFEHTSTLLNNSAVLAAAGAGPSGVLNSAELYSAASADFSLTGNLSDAREGHTSTLLSSGLALIVGGFNGSVYLSSAELYEPGPLTPPNLASISIRPANPTIPLGGAQPMIATGTFSDGTTQQLASVTWSSSNPAAVSIGNDSTDPGAAYGATANGSATLTACAGSICGSTNATVGPPALLSIAVTPANGTVASGLSLQFSATGTYTDGSTQSLTSSSTLTWNSSIPYVATITSGGLATGYEEGISNISATVGSITGTATITVTNPVIVGLTVSPSSLYLSVGATQGLLATANMSDGTTSDVTEEVSWSVNGPPIATVNNRGQVTAQQNGSATIVAQSGGISASASLTVAPVASLIISPSSLSMAPSTSAQFHAIATLTDGKQEDVTALVSWSSMQSSVAGVNGGLVTAVNSGSTTIMAQGNGMSGSAGINVIEPTSLTIIPSPVSIIIGTSLQLRAVATLSDGTTEDVTAITMWTSAQPSIAAISNNGMVTGEQIGSTTIYAQADGQTASTMVTVLPLLMVSYYNLTNAQNSGADGTVYLAHPGMVPGDLCAMIYVFDSAQEMNECCGCLISDSGLRTLSLINDLTSNTLTGKQPVAGTVEILSSQPTAGQCNAGTITPAGTLVGWETNPQISTAGTYQVTEVPFQPSPLVSSEAQVLASECSMIQQLGSGAGTCTCGTGN